MKLSITIPVYNTEKYFPFTMDSVLAQSFFKENPEDYEIILVDDGSRDRSRDMCDEYAEQYDFIRVIHQENGGLSHARNVGLKEAEGTYVSMIDADDILHPDYYKKMVSVLDKTGLPVVKCDRYYLGAEEKPKFAPISLADSEIITAEKAIKNDLLELRRPLIVEGMCTKLYRRDVLKGLLFNENLRNEEDFLFVTELLFRLDKFAKIEDVLYFVVHNENSNTCNPDYLIRNINSITDSKLALIARLKDMNFADINVVINNSLFQIFDEYAFWLGKKNNQMPEEVTEKILADFAEYENIIDSRLLKAQWNALKNRNFFLIKLLQRKTFKSIYKRIHR